MKLTYFEEYINLISHNHYLKREIHVICGQQPAIDSVKFQSIKHRGVLYYNINIIKNLIVGVLFCIESISLTLTPNPVTVRKHLKHKVLKMYLKQKQWQPHKKHEESE